MNTDEPLPTRASLLNRLRDLGDDGSWHEFHRLYRGLLVGVARAAGLNVHEAEEAIQLILITVVRKLPEFHYDPGKDSFKGWLLQIARWKIADQFRKRGDQPMDSGDSSQTSTTEPVLTSSTTGERQHRARWRPDLPGPSEEFDCIWEAEWERHLLEQALAVVKRQANPAHYAIYHMHVLQEQPVDQVRRTLDVSAGQVYLAKHRVGGLLKRELRRLRQEAG